MGRLFTILIVVAALVLPTVASADELEQFEEHLEAGVAALDAGDYEEGLYQLERAREYHDHPLLRYHIARALEGLEECAAAKVQYRIVVGHDKSPPKLVDRSRDALDTIDEWCGDVVRTGADEPPEPPQDRKEGSARAVWKGVGWSATGVGAGLLVLGVGKFLLVDKPAVANWRRFFDEAGCPLESDNSLPPGCDSELVRDEHRQFTEDLASANRTNIIVYTTGLVIAAAGAATLTVLALTKDHDAEVSIVSGPGLYLVARF